MNMKLTAEGTFDSNSSPVPPLYVCKDRVMRHERNACSLGVWTRRYGNRDRLKPDASDKGRRPPFSICAVHARLGTFRFSLVYEPGHARSYGDVT